MSMKFTRADVAKELGVDPNTIYRWEKRDDCPVKPKKLKRSGQLRYTQADIDALRSWKEEFEE